jgi:penicillin amidase
MWLRLLAPRPPEPGTIDLATRLAALTAREAPLEHPCAVRWNEHAVPFIEAECDRDLAVALGVIHAHLRLGQMEMLRRVSRGRISEMIGAAALSIDHTIRIIDFGRAVPEMLRRMPSETRAWLAAYVSGINHVLHHAPLPHEFDLFGLTRESWCIDDVLTLGRLLSFDNSWLVWRGLLQSHGAPGWKALWAKLIAHGGLTPDQTDDAVPAAGLAAVNNRSGSNALAISAARAGRTWLVSDPHLGLSLPCVWLMVGYRTPERAAVGLTVPGTPFLAMGRTPSIAWSGTSLHAHASELCDVSQLPDNRIMAREETVRVRWGQPRRLVVRSCEAGPLLSDSPFFKNTKRLALRWVGHQPSDEVTAMIGLSTAADWPTFKASLEHFAVPGLNMLYADAAGHVGHALAAWIPKQPPADDLVAPLSEGWKELVHAGGLPSWSDPPRGFVASANDRPALEAVDVTIGRFFSSPGRADRIVTLVEQSTAVDISTLARLQQDVKSETSLRLARRLADAAHNDGGVRGKARNLLGLLATWDGCYDAASKGAALFETLLHDIARRYYARETLGAYSATWSLRDLIRTDLEAAPTPQVGALVRAALERCARHGGIPAWGERHRLRLEHPLGSLPGAKCYRFFDLPASGSSDTVMKTSNGLAKGRHSVRFGSNARQICDLSDPDENHFVLLGGQDGWLGSTTFADQVSLWRDGHYIRLPLQEAAVRSAFPHVCRLLPAKR